MNLYICSTTFQETAENDSRFPPSLRQLICQSVEQIPIDDMEQLLSKHETDPDNFDGRIEANLRNSLSNSSINSNYRISDRTRFNSDIVIHTENISVCLEIEKGYMSRFEFDILKMQTFASTLLQEDAKRQVFGGFIVPADNVVARHISGNSNESSYKYLTRLSGLVTQIKPLLLEDILIIGYSTSELTKEIESVRRRTPASIKRPISYLVNGDDGAKGLMAIKQRLNKYPLELTFKLRNMLASEFPNLREKPNFKCRYLGYANGNRSDAFYVYIQKRRLILDIRVSQEEAENLRNKGFRVNPRNNYQSKAGWLTGVSVPHDTKKLDVIVELVSLALEG